MTQIQIPNIHILTSQIQVRYSSNIQMCDHLYRQDVSVCLEFTLTPVKYQCYNILQFQAVWPKNNGSKKEYKFNFIGQRAILPRFNEAKKQLYTMVDKDNYDIKGVKLNMKIGKAKTMNLTLDLIEDEKFKFKNECMFGNLFEYYHTNNEDPQCLVVDARLTTAMRQHLNFQQ